MTTSAELIQAVELHQSGELPRAETLYRHVLKSDPLEANALNLLGVLCGQTDRIEEALTLLTRAVQSRDGFVSAHYNYGNMFLAAERMEEAEGQFRIVIQIDPNHASAHYNLGAVLIRQERLDEAVESFRNAVGADPLHDQAWHHLAMTLFQLEQIEAAVESWRCAIHANDQCVDYHHNLGHALQVLKQYEEAERNYRTALRLQPESVATWCNLGSLLREAGRTDEAIECCTKALELDPNSVDALNNLANIHLSRGDHAEALHLADRAIGLNEEHAAALITAAGALRQAHRSSEVITKLDQALALDPEDVATLLLRGETLLGLGRLADAKADYEKAHDLESGNLKACNGLARIAMAEGRTDEAEAMLGPLTKPPHDDAEAVDLLASLKRRQDRHEEAITLLEPRLENPDLNPLHRRRFHYGLGESCDALGRWDEAFDWFRRTNETHDETFQIAETQSLFERLIKTFEGESESVRGRGRLPRAANECDRGLFIVGMPRSGTTLVEQILDCHPRMKGVGEANFFVPTILQLTDLIDMQTFPESLKTLTQEHVDMMGRTCIDRLDAYSTSHDRIVEKTPDNFRFLGLLQLLMPGSRVIWCRRHPLDTCLSCYFHEFTGWHPYAYDLESLGAYHRLHERLMHHWQEVLDLKILEVQYETLVENQEIESRRMIEFAELEWDDACLRFHENPRFVTSASAHQVRKPMYTSSVGRYRHYLNHLQPLIEALQLDPADHEAPDQKVGS